jgi:hypothetical protein
MAREAVPWSAARLDGDGGWASFKLDGVGVAMEALQLLCTAAG